MPGWQRYSKQRPELQTERWHRLSRQVRREEPLCRPCSVAGRITLATEVDHINEDHPDPFDRANLQPICRACNLEKEVRRKGDTVHTKHGTSLHGAPRDPNHHWNKP